MHEALSLSRRIGRAIAVSVLSFSLMVYLLHLIPWGGLPDFWGGAVLLVNRYVAGDLTPEFWRVWLKAVVFSSTEWPGALELSAAGEISCFVAWQVDRFFIRYHSRFLLDSNSNSKN